MTRVEDLRKSRKSYVVRWLDYVTNAEKYPDSLHCFFEGKDAKYYGVRIRLIAKTSDIVEYRCGGKESVRKLISLMTTQEQSRKTISLFFIDRDFDRDESYSESANVYLTDGYSIENYYVSREAICQTLAGEFGLDPQDDSDELSTVENMCESALGSFIEEVRELNAWIAAIRDTEHATRGGRRLNLASHSIVDFVRPSLRGNQRAYSVDQLAARFDTEPPAEDAFMRRMKEFSETDGRLYFRGKWLLEALRKYLVELQEDRNSKKPNIFSKKGRAPIQLSKDNLISALSQYADTPRSLFRFLSQFAT